LKTNDDYVINSIMDIIILMARWVLPRSSQSEVDLPVVVLSPHQMKVIHERCMDTFGPLLTEGESPLGILIGQFDPQSGE
jgi:hypothetical protein